MFVRTTRRRYKGQTYTNYVRVESVGTAKGPRQKVVCSLGDLSPRPRAPWLALARKVGAALGGQPELLAADAEVVERVRCARPRRQRGPAADLISVHAERIRTEEHRTAGPVHAGVQYWRKLGADEILATIGVSERPIFHHLEHRVETHIFLCVLAYHLLVAVENTLLDKGVHTSWLTVRQTLETHQVRTVVLPTDRGAVLRLRRGSTPEPAHRQLYELLGVPFEVMRPQRRWSEPDDETEM